jgi:hypothetical protein
MGEAPTEGHTVAPTEAPTEAPTAATQAAATQAEAPPRSLAARIPSQPHVTAALTIPQARQLVHAHYIVRFGPHDDAHLAEAVRLLRLYVMYGYNARLIGPYRQHALCVGHGLQPRKFHNLPQYAPHRLSAAVLNRIVQPGGRLHGEATRPARRKNELERRRAVRNDRHYAPALRRPPPAPRMANGDDDDDGVEWE